MEFIKNEKEREKTFFKLWNEEVNINDWFKLLIELFFLKLF